MGDHELPSESGAGTVAHGTAFGGHWVQGLNDARGVEMFVVARGMVNGNLKHWRGCLAQGGVRRKRNIIYDLVAELIWMISD